MPAHSAHLYTRYAFSQHSYRRRGRRRRTSSISHVWPQRTAATKSPAKNVGVNRHLQASWASQPMGSLFHCTAYLYSLLFHKIHAVDTGSSKATGLDRTWNKTSWKLSRLSDGRVVVSVSNQRLVLTEMVNVSVMGGWRSLLFRSFTSRARCQFSAKLCRP